MKSILTLLMVSAAFAADNPPPPAHSATQWPDNPTARYEPWGKISLKSCLPQWSHGADGGNVQIGARGVRVVMTLVVVPQTGWHGHSATTPHARPQPTVLDYQPRAAGDNGSFGYALTGTDGCATFTWKGPGYSGWYALTITPGTQEGAAGTLYPKSWSTQGQNIYLGDVDWSALNFKTNYVNMGQLIINNEPLTAPMQLHQDDRHNNYSRAATRNTLHKLAVIAAGWKISGNPVIDVVRASLPDGGVADNQRDPVTDGYAVAEWTSQLMEQHALGNEVDVVNQGSAQFDLFEHYVSLAGCALGKLDPNGAALPSNASYWKTAPVVHVVCDKTRLAVQ